MKEEEYTSTDVCNQLGITQAKVVGWMSRGFIHPSLPSSGSGNKALFSYTDLLKCKLFMMLSEAGYYQKLASSIVYSDEVENALNEEGLGVAQIQICDGIVLTIDTSEIKAQIV